MQLRRTSHGENGYEQILIHAPDCPYSDKNGFINESRYIWWLHNPNSCQTTDTVIHHINGDSTDNKIENLQKMTKREHIQFHGRNKKTKSVPFTSYTKYALSYTDYMKIMMKCKTLEQTCLIGIACEYGLRRDDVVAIEIKNINLTEKRMIFYEHKKDRILSRPLSDIIVTDLTRHINALPKGTKFLFPAKRKTSKSGHMSGMEAWRTLQELCIQADIPMPVDRKDRPFHSLRGTCYKLKRNRDKWTAEQVAAWLGDTITTAMKHYGAVTDSELDDLVRGNI